jgi:pSer/pThr/pTyr-binding forkhead associated (FHA) protein
MGYKNYRLTVIKGFNKGEVFHLEQEEVTIGRGEDNTIVMGIAEVSRNHSALTKVEEGYMIRDLGSTNGTFVDKKAIGGKYLLKPGDTVMLGDAIYMTYMAEPDPEVTGVTPRQKQPDSQQVTAVMPKPAKAAQEKTPEEPAVPQETKTAEEMLKETPVSEEKKSNTWLWAGIGCLVIILFLLTAGAILFDFLGLYCTPPFDSILGPILNYTCP